jgi:hypothetical protein
VIGAQCVPEVRVGLAQRRRRSAWERFGNVRKANDRTTGLAQRDTVAALGYRPVGEIDDDTVGEIAEVTRALLTTGGYDGLVALASFRIDLDGDSGMTGTAQTDLVLAAQAAWKSSITTLRYRSC